MIWVFIALIGSNNLSPLTRDFNTKKECLEFGLILEKEFKGRWVEKTCIGVRK